MALDAGAADDESAGADEAALSGEAAGGVPPPHATTAPTDIMAARRATIAMFFMIVFSSERVPSEVEDAGSYASVRREPSITRLRQRDGSPSFDADRAGFWPGTRFLG